MDDYEGIPYQSHAIPESHPEHLAVLARLHGLKPPNPRQCRVLELACASGGNLIPMAWQLPGSEFVGIDLGASQIREGQQRIKASGLTNIRLIHADILDHQPDGQYDYLIAHGLYSWVPAPVRQAIRDLCRDHLAPDGIAYLSYNTLPGWRMRGMLRDMLLQSVPASADPAQRLQRATAFLAELEHALCDIDALHSQYLRHEIRHIRDTHPSYLYHEYLAEINEPFLYTRFVTEVLNHHLKPLCDARLHTHFPVSLGERAQAMLNRSDDPLTQQQTYDFLVNRNFRQTLLCHTDVMPSERADPERLAEMAIFSSLVPPRKLDLRKAKAQPFADRHGHPHPIRHPLTKAALTLLAQQHPAALAYPELEAHAVAQVNQQGDRRLANQIEHLFGELFMLYVHQHIGASPLAEPHPEYQTDRPRASVHARVEAQLGQLTGRRHHTLRLADDETRLIQLLDGSRDHVALLAAMNAQRQGQALDRMWLEGVLQRLAAEGILE